MSEISKARPCPRMKKPSLRKKQKVDITTATPIAARCKIAKISREITLMKLLTRLDPIKCRISKAKCTAIQIVHQSEKNNSANLIQSTMTVLETKVATGIQIRLRFPTAA